MPLSLSFHALHFALFDGFCSIVGLTESNGTLVSTYACDPYGNLTSTTGNIANPWRYASGYLDSSTGLYKFGARYYDPTIGRWTQQDLLSGSLSDPTSLNRYLYAGDDPVNLTDPSGRQGCSGTQILILAGLLIAALILLAGVALSLPADALVSITALFAFLSAEASLPTLLMLIGSILTAQFSALGLADCLSSVGL